MDLTTQDEAPDDIYQRALKAGMVDPGVEMVLTQGSKGAQAGFTVHFHIWAQFIDITLPDGQELDIDELLVEGVPFTRHGQTRMSFTPNRVRLNVQPSGRLILAGSLLVIKARHPILEVRITGDRLNPYKAQVAMQNALSAFAEVGAAARPVRVPFDLQLKLQEAFDAWANGEAQLKVELAPGDTNSAAYLKVLRLGDALANAADRLLKAL